MKWKQFLTVIVSIILIVPIEQWVKACAGGEDPYDYYTSFFSNQLGGGPAYTPFYYTGALLYYDEWYDYPADARIPDPNIDAWEQYCNKEATHADIDSFLYGYAYGSVSNLYYHLEKGSNLLLPAVMMQNSFTRWFQRTRDLEALGYLMHAKQCQPFAVEPAWNAPKRDSAKMLRLAKNATQLYAAAKTDFIRQRYAYQAMRMAFYAGNNDAARQLYDTLVQGKMKEGEMYYNCLSMYAGILFRSGKKADAAYIYSQVFDHSDQLKRRAYISFDWSVNKNIDEVLGKCKTAHEKAVIYVMRGLNEYEEGLPYIELAYKSDPAVRGLDVLMTREINKMEERYLTPLLNERRKLPDYWGDLPGADRTKMAALQAYLSRLNTFAKKVIAEEKNGRRQFWLLTTSYLYYLAQDMEPCRQYMDLAQKAGLNGRERDMHDIINVLYTVNRKGVVDESIEAELLKPMKWLEQRAEKDRDRFGANFENAKSMVLAAAYMKQKDTVKAFCALAHAIPDPDASEESEFYYGDLPGGLLERMSLGKLKEVQAFMAKKDKTPFETWLVTGSPYSLSRLWELEGTRYLRMHQFDKAELVLRKVNDADLKKIVLPNVLADHLKDQQDWERSDSLVLYNKLSFARKMLELEAKLKATPEDAEINYQYATGLYSMSYYGRAAHAYVYWRSGSDGDAYYTTAARKEMDKVLRDFYSVELPEQYYAKAASLFTDKEKKVRALFMAAKCWQKRCAPPKDYHGYRGWGDDNVYYLNAVKNPYFREIQEYKGTANYNKMYSSCSYLRSYVKRQNRSK